MSFTTRCPACGTTFKVVPDQLKISDGWVRCGHCADVFDATLYLQEDSSPTPAPAPVPKPAPPISAPAVPAVPHDDGDGDWLLAPRPRAPEPDPVEAWSTAEFLALDRAAPAETVVQPDPMRVDTGAGDPWAEPSVKARQDTDNIASRFTEELKQFASASTGAGAGAPLPAGEPASEPVPLEAGNEPEAERAAEADASPAATSTETPVPGFVRQAQRKAFWRSPVVRAVLAVASVLLGVLLVLQWALHERDRLAAQHPSAVPLLASLCKTMGCRLGPVRQIDAVVIDSSNLVRRLGNFYAFDLVLKNSAPMPVAVPALELSLTDTRDAVIARRVFLPDELPGTPVLLPAQGSLSVSLRLSIADSGVSAMTGYRALVFYP